MENVLIVEPHHLQNYMASWVLIAWCLTHQDWRKFYLSRMQSPETLSRTFTRKPRDAWEYLLEDAFGIFVLTLGGRINKGCVSGMVY
jgi:predicted DNA-binding transcriptional regulator YafY